MNTPSVGVCIFADDVAQTARFYVDHFGFERRTDIGWFVTLGHGASSYELALTARNYESLPAQHRHETPAGVMIAVIVEDATAKARELEAAGIPYVTELKDEPWGQRHFVVRDPDGTLVEGVEIITPDPAWLAEHGFQPEGTRTPADRKTMVSGTVGQGT